MAGDRTSEPGMTVTIGIARETAPGERRVAVTPETCRKLVAAGASVRVERGLGDNAHFPDAAYADAGAELVGGSDDARAEADITLCVQPPEPAAIRSEEHTSELQSLMRISYAVFCLKQKRENNHLNHYYNK